MAWKNHKKWHGGKQEQLAAGEPVHRPAAEAVPAAKAVVPQGNFTATISVSPAIMQSRALTADHLQVALDAALQALVRFEKTVSVHVVAAK